MLSRKLALLGIRGPTAVCVGAGVDRMVENLTERCDPRPPPFALPLMRSSVKVEREIDSMLHDPVKEGVDTSEFVKLLEQQRHNGARLLVWIEGNFSRGQQDVSHGHT